MSDASESENPAIPAPTAEAHRPRTNQDWWPNQPDLQVLRQHAPGATPLGQDFDYKETFAGLDVEALRRDLFEHAHGRVLLHGLGLGCALSSLLADPAIEHVDVVEANADVIDMVAPYYRGYPVTIHHASCVDKVWPVEARWDYVWHDIWTEVTPENLDDATAEHGISYGRLAQLFAGRADRQGAWAFDLVTG